MEVLYHTIINTTYGENPTKTHTGECWKIVKLMVRVFIRELSKVRVVADTVYGTSYLHIRVDQYLWHTIQYHRVMKYFIVVDFHWYTSMAPSLVNNLFKNRASKVDIYVLKVNIWEQDNILAKQAKDIKPMKSTLDSFQDKLKGAKIWSCG